MDDQPPVFEESTRVATLRNYGILDTPREQDFDEICELAAHLCGVPIAMVSFVDAERQWVKSEIGVGATELPLETSFCRHALLETETMVVPDTLEDPRFRDNPFCTGGPMVRFYAGAVLRTPAGLALGTLCVFDQQPRQLEPKQRRFLVTLARQIMALLESRRQTTEAQQLAAMRGRISVSLGSAEPLSIILHRCAQTLVDSLDGAFARIWTLDEVESMLCLQASAGMYTHLNGPHGRVKVGD